MKKILVTAEKIANPRRGGARSLFAFLKRLSEDYEVTVITPGDADFVKGGFPYQLISKKRPFYVRIFKSYLKINIQNIWWKRILMKKLNREKFDLVISHGILLPSLLGLPSKKMIFIREVGFFSPGVDSVPPEKCHKTFYNYLPWIFKIQYPLLAYYRKKALESIRCADLVFSISQFTKKVTKSYTGKNSFILNPEVSREDYLSLSRDPKYILFVNPTRAKGVDLMRRIAESLPEKKFLVVGKGDLLGRKEYNLMASLPNVVFEGELSDMKTIYEKVKLLVNTSRCYEGFGRTPVEAMINGIPSVVSGAGALPEVVGNSGDVVRNFSLPSEWIKKIKKYDNPSYYHEKAIACKRRSKILQRRNEEQYKRLKREIDKII